MPHEMVIGYQHFRGALCHQGMHMHAPLKPLCRFGHLASLLCIYRVCYRIACKPQTTYLATVSTQNNFTHHTGQPQVQCKQKVKYFHNKLTSSIWSTQKVPLWNVLKCPQFYFRHFMHIKTFSNILPFLRMNSNTTRFFQGVRPKYSPAHAAFMVYVCTNNFYFGSHTINKVQNIGHPIQSHSFNGWQLLFYKNFRFSFPIQTLSL